MCYKYSQNNLPFNTEYLWKNLRNNEKKNSFFNIDSKINKWLLILLSNKKSEKNKYNNIFNIIINFSNNLLLRNNLNKSNILSKVLNFNNFFYIKNTNIWNKNIMLKKIWSRYLNKFVFKIDNLLINCLNLKTYESYQNIYKLNSDILYLLISYLYKKNIYAFSINKQEIHKIIIPLYNRTYFFNIQNMQIQSNFMFYILNYYNQIENYFFNESPNWLLNKNNTTIFYTTPKERKKKH